MHRREFLVRLGGVLVAVPFVLEAVSCGTDKSPTQPSDRFTAASASTSGHTHTINVLCVDVNGSGAVTYTSSSTGHTHTVTLQLADLQQIRMGNPVTVPSSLNAGHTHNWTIQKPAGVC